MSELAFLRTLHATAELLRERLHAVTDAENRRACVAQFEHHVRYSRRGVLRHRLGATRQYDATRAELANEIFRRIERMNLAVHAGFTDAPRDQLGVLGTEVDDQKALDMDVARHGVPCGQLTG